MSPEWRRSGSGWSHPANHDIYTAVQEVRDSPVVVATRLVNGKVTLIHRLWPGLARLAERLPADRLAAIQEEHTPAGAHRKKETPFHDWLPPEVSMAAERQPRTRGGRLGRPTSWSEAASDSRSSRARDGVVIALE
jgi:hypothetical protein